MLYDISKTVIPTFINLPKNRFISSFQKYEEINMFKMDKRTEIIISSLKSIRQFEHEQINE